MNLGTEDRRKMIIAGVAGFLAILAVGYGYETLFGGPSTPPPQAAPVILTAAKSTSGKAAVKVGTVSAQLDPTLHMEAMRRAESLVYSGTGRNIFAPGPTPQEIAEVKAKFDARPKPQPVAYTPPAPSGPPPPPPINLKFFGTETQQGVRRALLLSGDDVFLASAGDIVQRRYRIVTISANSITVEDVPNSNKQNLPLTAANP
jgi:hypothetical protein